MNVLGHNSGLVRLGNICKDDINHSYQESIVLRFSSIMNDRDNVSALFGHIH